MTMQRAEEEARKRKTLRSFKPKRTMRKGPEGRMQPVGPDPVPIEKRTFPGLPGKQRRPSPPKPKIGPRQRKPPPKMKPIPNWKGPPPKAVPIPTWKGPPPKAVPRIGAERRMQPVGPTAQRKIKKSVANGMGKNTLKKKRVQMEGY